MFSKRKCHVYIVMQFDVQGADRVVGVYAKREIADAHAKGLARKHGSTVGVLKKTVNGI